MSTRNYGTGTRDMNSAARILLKRACERGETSFSTVDTISDRVSHFFVFAKTNGVGRLERIEQPLVVKYGRSLADKVKCGEMSVSYSQNLVSAVNSVMSIARAGHWVSVSPTRDCGIAKRCAIRQDVPVALDRTRFNAVVEAIYSVLGPRLTAIVMLARELGLRSKEASLLDCCKAWQEAKDAGFVSIARGTKGGLKRRVPVTTEEQFKAMEFASGEQRKGSNLIPKGMSWKAWRERDLRKAREIVKDLTGGGLHDLRAAFACERYETLSGHSAPVAGGVIVDRDKDLQAREQIAEELGHGRIAVVAEYVGGRRS